MRPPKVMVSYQSADLEAARLLRDEIALRGMEVLWDRETFIQGERLESEMARAVEQCDAFVIYLTPSSLYLDRPDLEHKPVIDDELRPAMQRRRNALAIQARLSDPDTVRPVIFPIAHSLGDPREDALHQVRQVSGEDLSTLWAPLTIDQSTSAIQPPEAAAVARALLRSLLTQGDGLEEIVQLTVCSRGTRRPGGTFNLDATALLGGDERRPGSPESWQRFFTAMRDVEGTLKAHSPSRKILFHLSLHLSGAIALGRIFHQAANWRLAIEGRHGVARLTSEASSGDLQTVWDQGSSSADAATLEIELLRHPVRDMATDLISTFSRPLRGRLQFWRDSQKDLRPDQLGAFSKAIALRVQQTCGEKGVRRLHVLCSSPVEFAVLLGHQLTGMEVDLQLYERDGDHYTPSLLIPHTTP